MTAVRLIARAVRYVPCVFALPAAWISRIQTARMHTSEIVRPRTEYRTSR